MSRFQAFKIPRLLTLETVTSIRVPMYSGKPFSIWFTPHLIWLLVYKSMCIDMFKRWQSFEFLKPCQNKSNILNAVRTQNSTIIWTTAIKTSELIHKTLLNYMYIHRCCSYYTNNCLYSTSILQGKYCTLLYLNRSLHSSQKIAHLELIIQECEKWNENFHLLSNGQYFHCLCVYAYTYNGENKFSKNLWAPSKFWAPKGWHSLGTPGAQDLCTTVYICTPSPSFTP
jgi:hypothetical protein